MLHCKTLSIYCEIKTYIYTMYVFCVYPAMSTKPIQTKRTEKASFCAFHKCCQGCLLRGPRYISTSFILVCALRCTQLQGTRKVYSQAEKFIRRLKSLFVQYEKSKNVFAQHICTANVLIAEYLYFNISLTLAKKYKFISAIRIKNITIADYELFFLSL